MKQSVNSSIAKPLLSFCAWGTIQSYTYISSQDRLVRLTNHDHIVDADWKDLCRALQKEGDDYRGDIEDLFQAELYLISPVSEPARFLQKEYFLTSQQRDIQRRDLERSFVSGGTDIFVLPAFPEREKRFFYMILP